MRYWKINNDNTVDKVYGSFEKPYPENIIDQDSVDLSLWDIDAEGLRYDNGTIRVITEQEGQELHDKNEAIRQSNKPIVHKTIENNFLKLCMYIFGDLTKRGFDELGSAIDNLKLTNFPAAVELGLKLSAVNQEGIREIGTRWWDDCVWHPEIES